MATETEPSDLWAPLASRAVEAGPTGLDDIAQRLQELTFEGADDDLEAFQAAWLPVLPSLVERADRADDVELAWGLQHIAGHLAAIDPHPDVRLLLDHAWARHLWLLAELPEVASTVLDFDDGERLHWYGDVGVGASGWPVCVDLPARYGEIDWRDSVPACHEVCVTSSRARFLRFNHELVALPLEDLDVVVVDDATVLLRVGREKTRLAAALPLTFRAAVARAREAAGSPPPDFGAESPTILQRARNDVQPDTPYGDQAEPSAEDGGTR